MSFEQRCRAQTISESVSGSPSESSLGVRMSPWKTWTWTWTWTWT